MVSKILSSSEPPSASPQSKPKQRRRFGDVLVVVAIAVFVLFGCFGRTVISQKVISNLAGLAVGDIFFNNEFRFAVPRPSFDPSLYQFHIPFQLYAAREMSHLQIPMWNPCFGCGFPTIAELQYCTFSPLRGIFGASNQYIYNLGIAVKAMIGALSTFYLVRLLSASRGAGAFAAISYALCPLILRELELPDELELFPAVACAFLCLANRNTLGGRFLLGLCAALTVFCMHPEFAFLSVVFAVITLAFGKQISATTTEPSKLEFLPPQDWLKNLLIAALVGSCLAAPLLFPFIELMASADSYKFHDGFIQKVPLETLLVGLVTPICKGGSPFVGVIALALAIFAAFSSGKRLLPLSLTAFVLILWISAPGPLAALVAMKPISFIAPRYFLPSLLLYLSLLAAYGVDLFSNAILQKQWKRLIPLSLLTIVLAATPFLLDRFNLVFIGFDGTLSAPALVPQAFIKGAAALGLLFLLIALCKFIKSSWTPAIPYLLLLANLFSLGDAARLSLPPTIPFTYTSSPALDVIKAAGERMTACGRMFFCPNISMVYDIRDFRSTGPIIPKWVTAFQKIEEKDNRSLYQSTMPSPLLDAASVKYLIARWPIRDAGEKAYVFKPISALSGTPRLVLDQLALLGVSYCLTESGELFVRTTWRALGDKTYFFAPQMDIVAQSGKTIRRGARINIKLVKPGEELTQENSIKVPDTKGEKFFVVLYLNNILNEAQVPINKLDMRMRGNGIELLDLSEAQSMTGENPKRMELVKEDSNQILLYKNNQALPQAYLSNNILKANSLDEAVKFLSNPGFDPHQQTIVETNRILKSGKPQFLIPAVTERKNSSTVVVNADAPSDCYLILTDTFYNGWSAFVEDKPAPIERANVCFRAVKLPPGAHTVRFEFMPVSVLAGIAVAALSLLILGAAAWMNMQKKTKLD